MIKVLVISDDCAASTGFGTVIRHLFGPMQNSVDVEINALAMYPRPAELIRVVRTIRTKGPPSDEYGQETMIKYMNQYGQPDIIFLLGDWWYWKSTLLSRKWRAARNILSSIWYYCPIDGVQMSDISRNVYLAADQLIAMSPFGVKELREYTGREPFYLPHGYDDRVFQYREKKEKEIFTFGVVSRNAKRKNIWAIIEAFRELPESVKANLLLHVAPDDLVGGNLKAYIHHTNTESENKIIWSDKIKVEINGSTSSICGCKDHELAEIYHSMDCIVSAGREGFGLPYLEARVCGCQVVLPTYSAHASMNYDGAICYPVNHWKPEPHNPDVLDMVPEIPVISNAMMKAWSCRNKPLGPMRNAENLTWKKASDTLLDKILEHGHCKAVDQIEESKVFYEIINRMTKHQKKILVVMPGNRGDLLLLTATLNSLKKKYPEHKLVVATEERYFCLLEGCPWVDELVNYNPHIHKDYSALHKIYEIAFTPFFRTQVTANWVLGGHGRCLAETYANDCGVELGEYWCPTEAVLGLPERYVTLHAGSGTGEWVARNYPHWEKVVDLVSDSIPVVQIGVIEDMTIGPKVIDMRGKYSLKQSLGAIKGAALHVGIDSYPMHASAVLGTKSVIIWGNTFPHMSGPEPRLRHLMTAIEADRKPCIRACHFLKCSYGDPCLRRIDPAVIAEAILKGVK